MPSSVRYEPWRARRSFQSTSVASKSGPSTQANLVLPPTSTRQQPHMPVPSTMIGFREAMMGMFSSWQVMAENFIIGTGPTQKAASMAPASQRRLSGRVTTPFSPSEPSSVVM